MRNLFLVIFITLYGFTTSGAQNNDFIAFTGGFLNASNKSVAEDETVTKGSEAGFYAGFLAEVYISNEIWFQPELVYARVKETNYIQMPLLVKFYVSDKVNLLVGPQISYTVNDVPDEFTKFNVGGNLGMGYNLTKKLLFHAKYAFQINDYYTGSGDSSLKANFLSIGLAYKFKILN